MGEEERVADHAQAEPAAAADGSPRPPLLSLFVRRQKHCERGSVMKAFFLAAFVAGACIASAANTCLGADKDELQGEWVATSGEINGKPYPAEALKRTRFTFKGDALL